MGNRTKQPFPGSHDLKTGQVFLSAFLGIMAMVSVSGLTPGAAGQISPSLTPTPVEPSSPALAAGRESEGRTSGPQTITLDVVVNGKGDRQPIAGLLQQDFTLLDNKQPQKIIAFAETSGVSAKPDPPVEAVLVVDTINPPFHVVEEVRQWVTDFLRQNGGHLTLPTSLVVLTDKGATFQNPTRDGNVLVSFLNDNRTGLRTIRRSQGIYGAAELRDLSLRALYLLAGDLSKQPGRKLLIWISPGWPALSRQTWYISPKDQQTLFSYIASVSTELRDARVTLYSIDPLGAGHMQFYYENYLKGVRDAKHADFGDLFLPVLAYQSGGLALSGSNDVTTLIGQCVVDANAYYELTFHALPADGPNDYHDLQVQVNKPGLKARTRAGYYAQP